MLEWDLEDRVRKPKAGPRLPRPTFEWAVPQIEAIVGTIEDAGHFNRSSLSLSIVDGALYMGGFKVQRYKHFEAPIRVLGLAGLANIADTVSQELAHTHHFRKLGLDASYKLAENYVRFYIFNGSPRNYMRRLRGMMYEAFIKPIDKRLLLGLCFSGVARQLNPHTVNQVIASQALLNQALRDGNRHLTPFILHFGVDTQQLKLRFGNGLWKALCRNSFSRNKLLMTAVKAQKENRRNEHISAELLMGAMNELPSTLLSWFSFRHEIHSIREFKEEIVIGMRNLCKGKYKNKGNCHVIYIALNDCCSMARQLGLVIRPSEWVSRDSMMSIERCRWPSHVNKRCRAPYRSRYRWVRSVLVSTSSLRCRQPVRS